MSTITSSPHHAYQVEALSAKIILPASTVTHISKYFQSAPCMPSRSPERQTYPPFGYSQPYLQVLQICTMHVKLKPWAPNFSFLLLLPVQTTTTRTKPSNKRTVLPFFLVHPWIYLLFIFNLFCLFLILYSLSCSLYLLPTVPCTYNNINLFTRINDINFTGNICSDSVAKKIKFSWVTSLRIHVYIYITTLQVFNVIISC